MGNPRLIVLVRHGQSEGNKNRDIHQYIPDHRVKLTPQGWLDAEGAGRSLKKLLKEDDTIRIFTSPYRRTRETTEGILRTLTADDESNKPSPFQRSDITVYEEPRLREQDFGNFQPCSVEMERLWQERADYGHFFYRIPNGESAADAYDRISGFNESLWRQFGDEQFPSVCILVTHGLMTRVFLMKWYHWSVEYFEDLRNIHHCESIVMERDENGKYVLQNALRTWSELHSRANGDEPPSPKGPQRRWGGCAMGCNHHNMSFPRKTKRTSTVDLIQPKEPEVDSSEADDHPIAAQEERKSTTAPPRSKSVQRFTSSTILHDYERSNQSELLSSKYGSRSGQHDSAAQEEDDEHELIMTPRLRHLHGGRDGGGSMSGIATPADYSEDSDLDTRHKPESQRIARSQAKRSNLAQVSEDSAVVGRRHGSPSSKREGSVPTSPLKPDTRDPNGNGTNATTKDDLEPGEGTPQGDIY